MPTQRQAHIQDKHIRTQEILAHRKFLCNIVRYVSVLFKHQCNSLTSDCVISIPLFICCEL